MAKTVKQNILDTVAEHLVGGKIDFFSTKDVNERELHLYPFNDDKMNSSLFSLILHEDGTWSTE